MTPEEFSEFITRGTIKLAKRIKKRSPLEILKEAKDENDPELASSATLFIFLTNPVGIRGYAKLLEIVQELLDSGKREEEILKLVKKEVRKARKELEWRNFVMYGNAG